VAVANVVLQTASLSVGIGGSQLSKAFFTPVHSLNLENHFECVEIATKDSQDLDTRLLHILEDCHDKLWPDIANRPPWKVIAVVNSEPAQGSLHVDVVFALHHAIGDGRTSALFHTRLLDELTLPSGQPPQLSGHMLDVSAKPPLVRPQEEVINFSTSWRFLLNVLWHEFAPAWLRGKPAEVPWTGKPVAQEPFRTKLRLIEMSPTATSRLLSSCRAHKTTLTPMLHAQVLASLSQHLPAATATVFRGSTPVDLRPFASGEEQSSSLVGSMGVFVTSQTHDFGSSTVARIRQVEYAEEDVWRIAAELRKDMKMRLDSIPEDDISGMLGWVGNWSQFWVSKVGKPRETTWEVSNIGSMYGVSSNRDRKDGMGEPGWQIRRSILSQGATVAGAAIAISVSGIAKGAICMALTWQEGIVDNGIIDKLAADLSKINSA